MSVGSQAITFEELERHRRGLTGYCYRMLGSAFDAEDAVQETMIRAWRRHEDLKDPSALRGWLYRIATNVCMDALRGPQRRVRPMDLGAPSPSPSSPGTARPETEWIWPIPDQHVAPVPGGDPAEVAAARDSIRLAFVAALQHLPAKQRAVLILRDVLRWQATEVAELLDVSVISVNSALQRARAAMSATGVDGDRPPIDPEQEALVTKYVHAFQTFDLDALTSLLHLEATLSMPPYERWLRGSSQLRDWWAGPGNGCRGSLLCRVTANGSPAFGQYRPGGRPWALQVLELSDGKITAINAFLDTDRLFPLFGLPPTSDM